MQRKTEGKLGSNTLELKVGRSLGIRKATYTALGRGWYMTVRAGGTTSLPSIAGSRTDPGPPFPSCGRPPSSTPCLPGQPRRLVLLHDAPATALRPPLLSSMTLSTGHLAPSSRAAPSSHAGEGTSLRLAPSQSPRRGPSASQQPPRVCQARMNKTSSQEPQFSTG